MWKFPNWGGGGRGSATWEFFPHNPIFFLTTSLRQFFVLLQLKILLNSHDINHSHILWPSVASSPCHSVASFTIPVIHTWTTSTRAWPPNHRPSWWTSSHSVYIIFRWERAAFHLKQVLENVLRSLLPHLVLFEGNYFVSREDVEIFNVRSLVRVSIPLKLCLPWECPNCSP